MGTEKGGIWRWRREKDRRDFKSIPKQKDGTIRLFCIASLLHSYFALRYRMYHLDMGVMAIDKFSALRRISSRNQCSSRYSLNVADIEGISKFYLETPLCILQLTIPHRIRALRCMPMSMRTIPAKIFICRKTSLPCPSMCRQDRFIDSNLSKSTCRLLLSDLLRGRNSLPAGPRPICRQV